MIYPAVSKSVLSPVYMLRWTRTGSLQCDRMAVAHRLGVAMTGGGGGGGAATGLTTDTKSGVEP